MISRRKILNGIIFMSFNFLSMKSYPYNPKNMGHKKKSISSFDELRKFIPEDEGQVINLSGWHTKKNEGGGDFIAIKGFLEKDDGGIFAKVNDTWYWKRIVSDDYYTPEMFGAIGNGTNDDYIAIQNMLDAVPDKGIVHLDGKKIYYNEFSQDGKYANTWYRNKAITIYCNYALLTRRTPIRRGYTDNKSSLLKLTGEGPFYIHNPKINGNNPIGFIKDHNNNNTNFYGYSICECQDFGIHVVDAKDVNILNADISCCSFNIWVDTSVNIKITGKLYKSGQVIPNITPTDLAYGAGVKLLNSRNFNIDVYGEYNTNATVEIEPNNDNGYIKVISLKNLSNGLVIYNSSNIHFESYTKDTKSGNGTYIISNIGKGITKNIKGISITDGCSWIGTYIEIRSKSVNDMDNLNISSQSKNCENSGLAIRNATKNSKLNNVVINYNGDKNGKKADGYDMRFFGSMSGNIKGSIKNSIKGFRVDGDGSDLSIAMDLMEVASIPYSIGKDVKIDLSKIKYRH